MHSISQALALVAICVCAYYLGIYIRHYKLEDLSETATTSIRFACFPLILVSGIIISSQLGAARDGFVAKEQLLNQMAAVAVQMDRALTYYGAPAASAQKDFREYIKHMFNDPRALWLGMNRTNVEPFAVKLQTLPVPVTDTGVAAGTKKFLLDLMGTLSMDRYKLAAMPQHSTYAFTSVLLSLCLGMIFLCVGLTSDPLSGTAFWACLAISLCVGSTAFVTQEFENATAGLIQVRAASVDRLLKQISAPK